MGIKCLFAIFFQIAPHRDLYSDSGNNYLDQDTDSHSENNDHKTSANDAALPVDKRNTDTAQENSDDSDTETDLENVNAMMDKTKQEDDHDDKYGEDSEELAITDEAKRNMSEGIKQNDIPNDSEINGVSDKGGGKRSPGTISEDFEDINFDANDQSNNSEGKRDLDIFEDDNDVDDNDDEYDASETISRRKRNAETNDNLENSDFLSINSRTINDEDGSEDDKIDDNLRNEKNIADEDEEDDTDDGDDQYYFRKRRSTDEDDVDDDDEGDDGNDDVDDDNDEDDDGYADDDIDDEEIINRRKRSVNEVEEDYLNDILSRKRRSMEINDDDDDDDDADDDDEYDIYDTRKRRYTFDDENDVDDAECSRLRRFLYRGDDSDENNMDDDDDDDDDMESRNPRDSCSDLDSCGDSLHEKGKLSNV